VANVDHPKGFKAFGPRGSVSPYDKTTSGAVFNGDLVDMTEAGTLTAAAAGSVELMGVSDVYSAAATAATLLIVDDPDQKIVGQEDSTGENVALEMIGFNYDHLATTGNTTTGNSAHEIDSSTKVAATAGLRLLDLLDRPDNAVGANAQYVCRINEHHLTKLVGK
tara:strand:- start:6163 stop:6657 length:495 start_codon:yes stop_codon:yes gene_type:complete